MWSAPPAAWPVSARATRATKDSARVQSSPSSERTPNTRVVTTAATITITAWDWPVASPVM